MKTAIICDWLVTIGGAEKFLYHLLNCFPNADIFSIIDFLKPEDRHYVHGKITTNTFIQHLPFAKRLYRYYLPLMPFAMEQLDLSSYDLVISSSHAAAKCVITGPYQLHISYVHSPMRYAWDLQHQYLKETGLDKKWRGWLIRYLLHRLRQNDLRSAANVDAFIANSHFIAKRIEKIYRRNAHVIYPPVDVGIISYAAKENFYLTASRLVPYKRIDLLVNAFNQLPDRELIIIGEGPEYSKIKKLAGPNIKLLGYQPDEVLRDYLTRARAFLFAAEEDFGMLPVEAQAAGTPVIAYARGGALETVRGLKQSNPTGVFFSEQNTASVLSALEQFEKSSILAHDCIKQAACFSKEVFYTQIREFFDHVMQNKFQ